MTKIASSLIVSVFLLLLPVVCFAQATSSTSAVTGTVTDAQGAVVAGVTVKLVDSKTSQERTTTTNDQGVYLFAQVPPGQGYTLKFSANGFESLEMNGIALGVGNTETHNAQLTVGQVSSSVVVTAEAGATLNTTDASIGNVIEERRLKELPIQLRSSPASLIGLQPGVIGNNVGTGATNRVGSVTGSRADQGNITVDGIDANDQATGQAFATTGNAPIDAIQEFRTVTANPAASEGRSSGGQIELVTKSGTNDWHGSLREFNRTAATAANSFFNNRSGVKRPQLTRNQYGGSIGGPVYFPHFGEGGPSVFNGKDKLFFFFDYEARRDAQGVSYTRTVPLPHYRDGSLAFVKAGCPTNSRLNTNPNCITILTPAQVAALDPLHIGGNQALLSFVNQRYPLPNDLTLGDGINTGGFRFNAPSLRADNTYTGRVDWNISNAQRLFVRANKISANQTDTVNNVAAQFPGDPETAQIVTGDYAVAVGHNWTATPNFVNSATVGITKSVLDFPNLFHPSSPQSYGFTGLSTPFADFRTQARNVPVWTYRDDVNWTRGTHGLIFGGSLKTVNQQTNLTSDFNFPTVGLGGTTFASSLGSAAATNAVRPATLNTNAATRNAYDSALTFLLGSIPSITTLFNYNTSGTTFPLTTGRNRDWRYVEYEFYAGDTWKARSDLTLTYGVRWHIYPAPYEVNGFESIQNKEADFESIFNLRRANAAAGIATTTSEPFLVYNLGGKANNARPFYDTEYNNFGPRVAFAWNPSAQNGFLGKLFGDRKTVIRGGGTVTYDRPGGGITFLQDQNTYIFDSTITNNLPAANGAVALATFPRFTSINSVPFQNTAPPVTLPFTPRVTNGVGTGSQFGNQNYAVDPNFKIPYSIQYTFGFQRELPGNFIFEASYVGRQGRQLFALADAGQILDFKDPASGTFMIAALNQLQAQINSGGAITPIPWFENQMNAANIASRGVPCTGLGFASCTDIVVALNEFEVSIGDTADTIQSLRANRVLNPNVGLSSQFATNAYVTNKGSSSYDGMLLSLRKRFSSGFQFDVNYTWSHSIDNQSTVANTTTSGGLICDATDLRVCRGNSDFDIRHLMNVNGIWELPIGRGHRFGGNAPGWANAIIGGWEFTGILTARSGLPFHLATVSWPKTFIFDAANGVPVIINGDAKALKESIHDTPAGIQFFADPDAALAAVRYPVHGEIGNRNVLHSQPFWNVDSAVLKNFRLPWSETQRIQLRWESYNLFNHNVFAPPSTNNNPGINALNIGAGNFGIITTVQSTARVMQFGLRWDF